MRVGRAALDEEAIRLIEENNPDVTFDWTRILKSGEAAAADGEPRSERRRAGKADVRREKVAVPPEVKTVEVPPVDEQSEMLAEEALPSDVLEEPDELDTGTRPEERMTAALARLGPEGLQRLRARFAEVMARLGEKVTDPARLEELKSQAERLNPDTWVTDEEVRAGLEQYEAVFESLRSVIGHRRRRRRPRKPAGGGEP